MKDLYQRVEESVQALRDAIDFRPRAAMILGTGLGGVAGLIDVVERIPYERIPHFPESTVLGHEGDLVFGSLGGWDVVAMQGRFHFYEGYSLQETTVPVRVMRKLGAEILSINSAAGGLNPHLRAGDVMALTDHINMIGANPLRGIHDDRLGNRFPDMSRAYDDELLRTAGEVAVELRIPMGFGVYVAVAGPSLETRAETRMLRLLGADAVGMSTIPEAIVARSVGFRVLALAAITNVNLPDAMPPVSVESVIARAAEAGPKLGAVLEGTLRRLKDD